MKNQFIRLTSGWIPVSVLLLFAIALITGQARANRPDEIAAAPTLPLAMTSSDVVVTHDMLKKLEALPIVIDTILALPTDLGTGTDAMDDGTRDEHTPSLKSQ